MEFFSVSKEFYENYCLEFKLAFYEYEVGRWERKYGDKGVMVANGNSVGEVLCPAFLREGKTWRDVKMPSSSVMLLPDDKGVVKARVQ
jgi:hypothetical protein